MPRKLTFLPDYNYLYIGNKTLVHVISKQNVCECIRAYIIFPMPKEDIFKKHRYELISKITTSYLEKLLVKELGITYPEVIRYTSKDDGISGLLVYDFYMRMKILKTSIRIKLQMHHLNL